MVIFANAENVVSAEWQEEDHVDLTEQTSRKGYFRDLQSLCIAEANETVASGALFTEIPWRSPFEGFYRNLTNKRVTLSYTQAHNQGGAGRIGPHAKFFTLPGKMC